MRWLRFLLCSFPWFPALALLGCDRSAPPVARPEPVAASSSAVNPLAHSSPPADPVGSIAAASAASTHPAGAPRPQASVEHPTHQFHRPEHRFEDAAGWSRVFDSPERDAWQKPHEVIERLELRPDATVADIGAGTGYF